MYHLSKYFTIFVTSLVLPRIKFKLNWCIKIDFFSCLSLHPMFEGKARSSTLPKSKLLYDMTFTVNFGPGQKWLRKHLLNSQLYLLLWQHTFGASNKKTFYTISFLFSLCQCQYITPKDCIEWCQSFKTFLELKLQQNKS